MTLSNFRIFTLSFLSYLPGFIDTIFDVDFLPFDIFIGLAMFGICLYGIRKILFE